MRKQPILITLLGLSALLATHLLFPPWGAALRSKRLLGRHDRTAQLKAEARRLKMTSTTSTTTTTTTTTTAAAAAAFTQCDCDSIGCSRRRDDLSTCWLTILNLLLVLLVLQTKPLDNLLLVLKLRYLSLLD